MELEHLLKHFKLFQRTLRYIDKHNHYFRLHFEFVKTIGSNNSLPVGNKRISYKRHFYSICNNCCVSHGNWSSSFFAKGDY